MNPSPCAPLGYRSALMAGTGPEGMPSLSPTEVVLSSPEARRVAKRGLDCSSSREGSDDACTASKIDTAGRGTLLAPVTPLMRLDGRNRPYGLPITWAGALYPTGRYKEGPAGPHAAGGGPWPRSYCTAGRGPPEAAGTCHMTMYQTSHGETRHPSQAPRKPGPNPHDLRLRARPGHLYQKSHGEIRSRALTTSNARRCRSLRPTPLYLYQASHDETEGRWQAMDQKPRTRTPASRLTPIERHIREQEQASTKWGRWEQRLHKHGLKRVVLTVHTDDEEALRGFAASLRAKREGKE